MKVDGRQGGSFKQDEVTKMEVDLDEDNCVEVDEVNWVTQEDHEIRHESTWTRKDHGTSRLMLPGESGPKWSLCIR